MYSLTNLSTEYGKVRSLYRILNHTSSGFQRKARSIESVTAYHLSWQRWRGFRSETTPPRDITCMKNTALSTFRDSDYINNVPLHEMSNYVMDPAGINASNTHTNHQSCVTDITCYHRCSRCSALPGTSHINYLEGYICRFFNSKDPEQCLAWYSSYIPLRTGGGLQKCVMSRQFI